MATTKIVILNWNGAQHLARFLPSVVRNTPSWAGIVVADNGSTDDSLELLSNRFPTVETIRLDKNYGFAGGYNRALERIEADYAVLLNSDVETPEGWLEPLIATLEAMPDVAAVAPKLLSVAEPDRFEYAGAAGGYIDYLGYPFCRGRILGATERDEGQYDDARDVFWVSGAAFCCRLEAFRRAGGFDETFFAHMEEIDLCWRMQLAGMRIRIEPRSRVYHLGGGTLPTSSPAKLFYNHRNNLAMIFKCAPTRQRITAALLRPLCDLAAALSYLAAGNGAGFISVVRAWRDFIASHKRLSAARRTLRAQRTAEAGHIYKGSVVVRYLFGTRRFSSIKSLADDAKDPCCP